MPVWTPRRVHSLGSKVHARSLRAFAFAVPNGKSGGTRTERRHLPGNTHAVVLWNSEVTTVSVTFTPDPAIPHQARLTRGSILQLVNDGQRACTNS